MTRRLYENGYPRVVICAKCRERCVQGSNECKECSRRLCFRCFGDVEILSGICDECVQALSGEGQYDVSG